MNFITNFLMALLRERVGLCVDLIKIESAIIYLKALLQLRRLLSWTIGIVCLAALAMNGLLIVHIALYALLPWEPATKAWILLGLGLAYFLIPMLIFLRLCSRSRWAKVSHAEELAHSLAGK